MEKKEDRRGQRAHAEVTTETRVSLAQTYGLSPNAKCPACGRKAWEFGLRGTCDHCGHRWRVDETWAMMAWFIFLMAVLFGVGAFLLLWLGPRLFNYEVAW